MVADLFQLIKSMSKSEKRYFQLYVSMHVIGEKNGYIKLYECIAGQKSYDEALVKKVFKKEPFIKRFPATKNYLYHIILKSMRTYHTTRSTDTLLRNLLTDAEFLYDKTLYKPCQKILKKAQQIAVDHDKFDVLLGILRLQMKVNYNAEGYSSKQGQQKVEKYQEEVEDALKKNNNLVEYEKAYRVISSKYYIDGKVRSKRDNAVLEKIMNSPLYKDEHYPKSDTAKMHFYNENGISAAMMGNVKHSYAYWKKMLALIETSPEKFSERVLSYLGTLNNLTAHAGNLRRYKELRMMIEKMRNIPTLFPSACTEHVRMHIFIYSYTAEINECMWTGQFEKGPSIVKEMESGIRQYKENIPSFWLNLFYHNIAYIRFILGKHRQALEPLNRILNADETSTSKEMICASKIFNLLLHFELHNEELLPYMLKSVHHFLSVREKLYKVEKTIIDFFEKKLSRIPCGHSRVHAFRELKKDILRITKDPYEAKILEYFDIISWIESKIENTTFEKILKGKIKTKT